MFRYKNARARPVRRPREVVEDEAGNEEDEAGGEEESSVNHTQLFVMDGNTRVVLLPSAQPASGLTQGKLRVIERSSRRGVRVFRQQE